VEYDVKPAKSLTGETKYLKTWDCGKGFSFNFKIQVILQDIIKMKIFLLVFFAFTLAVSACDLLDEKGKHKKLIPPCPVEIFSFVLVFAICNLANATGIGGGGMLVPLLILLMHFQAHEAIPLSKSIILGGAIVSVLMSLLGKKNLIEFRIVSIFQPMILLGTAVGVTLNQLLPDLAILLMLTFTLGYVIYKNITKAVSLFKQESKNFQEEMKKRLEPDDLHPGELEMKGKSPKHEISYSFDTQPDEDRTQINTVALIALNYFAVLLFALMKGGGGGGVSSVVGIEPCTPSYWVLVSVYMIWCLASTILAFNFAKSHLNWSVGNLICYSSIAFLGGIGSGMLGLGGGVIISPLMLDIGVSPQSTAASSSLMVLFTSSSTSLQFFLGDMLDLEYAAVMFGISMLASLTGISFIGKMIKKYRRPSIIVFILAGITGFSAVLLPVYAYYMEKKTSLHALC
jgi:uncharacterized membrane protein YfcA